MLDSGAATGFSQEGARFFRNKLFQELRTDMFCSNVNCDVLSQFAWSVPNFKSFVPNLQAFYILVSPRAVMVSSTPWILSSRDLLYGSVAGRIWSDPVRLLSDYFWYTNRTQICCSLAHGG